MGYTKEDVLRIAREKDVKFIRLQFTDIFGQMKNVAITESQLEKALDNECMFDGSSIEGFVRINESDMYLRPDYDSFVILPWKDRVARLICDVYCADGETPFLGDPRNVLKKVIKEAADMGYTFNVGPECEFFLFKTNEDGSSTLVTNDDANYFDLAPVDLGENARRDMVLALEEMGFEIEASHHECAPGQHEIDFKYSDALSAADNIMTFKLAVRVVAQKHGLHATFMPKPVFGMAGSGMHLNQSLIKDGKNAFYDENGDAELSDVCYKYIAGVLKHARAFAAITNPTVNSYKRLVPGYEAPMYIAWSHKNRSPLVRIPAKRGMSTRIELRSPDSAANPYLALAAVLMSGLDGIKNNVELPPAMNTNLYMLSKSEKEKCHIEMLPDNLKEAIDLLKKDELMLKALGEHAEKQFIHAKEQEWASYSTRVTEWELKEYLNKI